MIRNCVISQIKLRKQVTLGVQGTFGHFDSSLVFKSKIERDLERERESERERERERESEREREKERVRSGEEREIQSQVERK